LKFINDLGSAGIPQDADSSSIRWEVQKSPSSPIEVELTMREVCGLQSSPEPTYDGQTVWTNGWIIRYISTPSNPCTEYLPASFDCKVTIMPFDEYSLISNYRRYGGPDGFSGGGIFKTNQFVTNEYQERPSDVDWDGSIGEIILNDFESDAHYIAVYLPPNGEKVCAYTSYSERQSSPWNSSHRISGATAGYLEPYINSFARSYLQGLASLDPPQCPITDQTGCQAGPTSYGVEMSQDPSESVSLDSDFDGEYLTATGRVDKKIFSQIETFRVELSSFSIDISDLTEEEGNHSMRLIIRDGGNTFSDDSFIMYSCNDMDGDGYCIEDNDCDDNNPLRNPGGEEFCNGIDDDCNGLVDDGIAGMGENLGKPCFDWPGSICRGSFVCNPEGTEIICIPDSGIYPGQSGEYCENKVDDDCDGTIDGQFELIDGQQKPACIPKDVWCVDGQTRPCGECKDGISSCTNGKWGDCVGGRSPDPEICNRLDDDCDGTVDNLFGKDSVEETKCVCYESGWPKVEICNGLDDDCDGEIDNGASNCCQDGEKRECGSDVGICDFGLQTCSVGSWGECEGEVTPMASDECCNARDDDCDGIIDEGCEDSLCGPGPSDPGDMSMVYWSMIGIGVIMLIGVLVYLEFIKKK
jgi:hypothetical protein